MSNASTTTATIANTGTASANGPAAMKASRSRRSAGALATIATAAAATRQLELSVLSHAHGALFPIEDKRIEEMRGKLRAQGVAEGDMPNLPIMSGTIQDADGVAISVSLFREVVKETGVEYASLSLGGKDRTRYYGKLFHTSEDNGPQYSGFIVVLPVTSREQYSAEDWEKAPRLQVCGWRRRSANGSARISLAIAPRVVGDHELPF